VSHRDKTLAFYNTELSTVVKICKIYYSIGLGSPNIDARQSGKLTKFDQNIGKCQGELISK
jgi:hypothetical protein